MTRPTVRQLALLGCGLVLAAAAGRVVVHDPTTLPVSGDQASFVYQALSLQGGDLAYDAADQARWLELGWSEQPHGLFVQQRDDGWAFAKPLGYSVVLTPAVAVAGARGISFVGAGLLVAYAACWYGLGRLRWDRVTAAVVAVVATVASHAWFFGFPAHADLFVAVLVGVAALAAAKVAARRSTGPGSTQPGGPDPRRSAWWLAVAVAATALLVTEKLPALLAVGPVVAVAMARSSTRARLIAGGVGAAVLAVSVVPYLCYSDGASWSAYGGNRFYALDATPWSGGTEADLLPWQTRDSLTPGFVLDSVTNPSDQLASAATTYAIGRHTGVATFSPIVACLVVAAVVVTLRRRRASGAGRTTDTAAGDPRLAAAAAVGLCAYVGLYLVVFTDNYFGGAQSVGNRYFLQVSVLVPLIAVAAGVSARAARWSGAVAVVAALALLTPHLRQPEEAFYRLERTSRVQRWLPFDGSQEHSWRFECEPTTCVAPPLRPLEEG